jgi:hypothetical protein
MVKEDGAGAIQRKRSEVTHKVIESVFMPCSLCTSVILCVSVVADPARN